MALFSNSGGEKIKAASSVLLGVTTAGGGVTAEIPCFNSLCMPCLCKHNCNVAGEDVRYCMGCTEVHIQVGASCHCHIHSDVLSCRSTASRSMFSMNVKCD